MRIFFLTGVLLPYFVLAQPGPVLVQLAPVRQGAMELSRPIVATVEPIIRSTLAAEEPGLVYERLFDEGQHVKKGDVLVRTNTELMRAQVVAVAAGIDALQSQIEQAKAERDRAEIEIERMRPVIEQRAAPQKEMDNAQRDLRVTTAVLANRTAMLAERKAEAARMTLMIEKSEVKSPIDGVVARRNVEVGQWIKQGDAVAVVVQLNPLHVRANVPESLVAQIQPGQTVSLSIDALPGRAISGKIDQIMPEADAASRTFAVKIIVPNPDLLIRPGFFARVTFLSGGKDSSWIVPKDAVISEAGNAHVVAARAGVAAVVPVQVLSMARDSVSVSGELAEGDLVVTRGNESLRGGEPLMPMGGPPPGPPPGDVGTAPASQPASDKPS